MWKEAAEVIFRLFHYFFYYIKSNYQAKNVIPYAFFMKVIFVTR